jgi:multicomponent Na+:H+ antiporter subunit B
MNAVFGIFLLTLMLITAIAVVRAKNLFVASTLMGIFSLLLAANFFLLDAADVALTEAAVGAGVSTVLFLSALSLTAEHEKPCDRDRVVALVVVTITTLALLHSSLDSPKVGDINAPVHQHVAPWYIEKTPTEIDVPNIVTAVLASFRGYDTLGEVFVVFTAGIGVLFLLAHYPHKPPHKPHEGLRHYMIQRLVGRTVVPFILLFGFYVQFHGDFGPGGGFQAGALIAAAIILYALLDGTDRAKEIIPPWLLKGMVAGGALLYGGVGIASMLLGGNFLDYSVLSSDPVAGQHLGILIIELGVGITVTGVLLSIFFAFASRKHF